MNNFNLNNYILLLDSLIKANYKFYKFQDALEGKECQSYVILRHDIDFSLDYVLDFAQVETQKNIGSTFFFHLRSPLYNLLSEEGRRILGTLYNAGHDVALHFDLSLCDDQISWNLKKELLIIKEFFPFANTNIVSFHRIGNLARSLQELRLFDYVRHTYDKKFFIDISYFSDSKGQWGSYGYPLESSVFKKRGSMQILTHPLWWVENGNTPMEKLSNLISRTRNESIRRIESSAITFSLKELHTNQLD